jgi:hypothetical protein
MDKAGSELGVTQTCSRYNRVSRHSQLRAIADGVIWDIEG